MFDVIEVYWLYWYVLDEIMLIEIFFWHSYCFSYCEEASDWKGSVLTTNLDWEKIFLYSNIKDLLLSTYAVINIYNQTQNKEL